jgi:Mrp family chromosome partitioning ATPase
MESSKTSGDNRGEGKNLVRLSRGVVVDRIEPGLIDPTMVSPTFFNAFNYSLLSRDRAGVNLTVGITSANPGEGKSLVAANLAVSLATANQRETVLVDLNVGAPRVHSVFGVPLSPGLFEAVQPGGGDIHVAPTRVNHLFVLPAGEARTGAPWTPPEGGDPTQPRPVGPVPAPSLGIEHISAFRDVILTLRERYEFVIVDLPSLNGPSVPLLLSHQIDGLLVVISVDQTKKEELDQMIHRLNEGQVLGFVYNRSNSTMFA